MKTTVCVFALAVIMFAFGIACDGDDNGDETETMTLDAYYAELSTLLTEFRTTSGAAFATLNGSDDVDTLQGAFADLPGALSGLLDGVGELSPPSEVEEAHERAQGVGDSYLAAMEEVNDDVQGAGTLDEFIAEAANDELQRLSEAFNAECQPLQDIADDNDVVVDLQCTE